MAVVQKALEFDYLAKLNKTGLSDVKATIELNGVTKASNVALTEVDATNSPGLYRLSLSAATLTGYGVASGQTNTLIAYITSASFPAAGIARIDATIANLDDVISVLGTPVTSSIAGDIAAIQTKLGAPVGASVSADIAAVKSDTAAIKADLETGSASLATLLTGIQQINNGSIGNGVGYVLPSALIPATGSNTYRWPITILNNDGALIDPTSNTVTVGLLNQSGTDRGAYLTGSSGTPATIAATRVSTGQYYVMVVIPSTAVEEELIPSFAYQVGTNSMVRFGQVQLSADVQAAGYALQTTLLATQTTVNAINSVVTNATYGNSALQALLTNATYGLSAQQTIEAAIQAAINNGTYGLAAANTLQLAIQSILNNGTYGNSALQVQGAATQGTGFTAGTDDLHSLSTYLRANLFVGGKAV